MAKSTDGERFYVMPTGELRSYYWPTGLYTFVAKSCGKGQPGVCYEIQSQIEECSSVRVSHTRFWLVKPV